MDSPSNSAGRPLHHFSRRGCRYYIQSALSLDTDEKREQEKRSLRLIGDSFKKIVVVNKVMKPYMDDDGILTMGLFDFLLNPNSLDF